MYQFDWAWLPDAIPSLAKAAVLTVGISFAVMVLSIPLGLVLSQLRSSPLRVVRFPVAFFIDFIRTTPLLLQVIFWFFFLPNFMKISLGAVGSGIVALTLHYSAFFAELFRSAVSSVGKGQREAAFALGMTPMTAYRRVIYPQALRRIMPAIGSMLVTLVKDTSLVSVLGVAELTNASQSVGATTFRYIEVIMVVGVMYFVMTYPLALWANWMHRQAVGS